MDAAGPNEGGMATNNDKLFSACITRRRRLSNGEEYSKSNQDFEWVMIELQGDLMVESNSTGAMSGGSGTEIDGLNLGSLKYVNGVPVLEVGYHRLDGSVHKMKKPFAVLVPQQAKSNEEGMENVAEFAILGIIREKIVFNSRPKPLQIRQDMRKRIKAP